MKSFRTLNWLTAVCLCLGVALSSALAQATLPSGRVGQAYSYNVTTTPAAPAGTIYAATGLPSGVSINSSSGVIAGTPTQAGTFTGVISLTLNSVTNNLDYSLAINPALDAPAITSATTATATVGQAFTYTVTASNDPASYNVGALPAGLSFDVGSHQIAGTPTSAGTYAVVLSANNASGTGASATLTLTINPVGPVPVISSAASASGTLVEGSSPARYAVNYQITGSNAPVSFSASGLPLGVTLNTTTGLISGETSIQGVYSVVLTATNNNGTSPSSALSLTIGSVSAISNAGTLNLTVGTAMTPFTLAASNSPTSFNIGGLPPGLAGDGATGVISGTPTAAGSASVNVSANNAVGIGPVATITLNISNPPPPDGGGGGTPAPAITNVATANAIAGEAFTFAVTASNNPSSFAATGLPAGLSINATTGAITGTTTITGVHAVTLSATGAGGTGFSQLALTVQARPAITTQPQSAVVTIGGGITLTVAGTGYPLPTYQWYKDGLAIVGAVGPTLTLGDFGARNAGTYQVELTNTTGSRRSDPAVLGVTTTSKVAADGREVNPDVKHPNGNIYDQVLLTGSSAAITADKDQVTRISFIDLDDDIVQVEMSGAGTLTLTLANATSPAKPVNYQQDVEYTKGHASIVITGADETTNVSVFTVGRATAFDPTGVYDLTLPAGANNDPAKNGSLLFQGHETTAYDGIADIASIAITTVNGKFGGVRTANVTYFASEGQTGLYAPGVAFQGPVFIGDITAFDTAKPVILLGSVDDARITGGDLLQDNAEPVRVSGLTHLRFTAGSDSHGQALLAKTNRAVFLQDGVDVTEQILSGP